MESWKLVLRKGFIPSLTNEQLTVLLHGLKTDDLRIQQGCTTTPPPLLCVHDWPCEAACALGYMMMMDAGRAASNSGPVTVGEVEEFFARLCYDADKLIGEPAACRWYLNFWDETPRPQAFALMIEEIEHALRNRGESTTTADPFIARANGIRQPSGLPQNREAEMVGSEAPFW